MKLAENLKIYRQKEGISQETLAEYCQVSRQAITKWENGESLPTIKNLIFLADFYHITLDELVGRKNDLSLFEEAVKRFIASDVKLGPDDNVVPVICRFLEFLDHHGFSTEDAYNGFKEVFLVDDDSE